jgi:hypothetical protein
MPIKPPKPKMLRDQLLELRINGLCALGKGEADIECVDLPNSLSLDELRSVIEAKKASAQLSSIDEY